MLDFLDLFPYTEIEEVDWSPRIKCKINFFVSKDGRSHSFLDWVCFCNQVCRLVDVRQDGKCQCRRVWIADHIARSVRLEIGQTGYERTR
jgi:hypothetical protein